MAAGDIATMHDSGGLLELTIDLAARELGRAVEYIERNNLTSGYTSVLWRTPGDDVGYWHDNLTASLAELREIRPEASPLERSNVLMKLRETLTDQGEKGTTLTVPGGISIFPSNVVFFVWGGLSSLLAAVLAGAAMVKDDWY